MMRFGLAALGFNTVTGPPRALQDFFRHFEFGKFEHAGSTSSRQKQSGAAARQIDPVKIVLVSVGADDPHAHAFADPVIQVDDLLKERERLRGAIAAII